MTTRAILKADAIVEANGSLCVLREYVDLAKKLNDVLKQNGFNHYTDEKFQQYETYISDNK